MDQRKLRGQDRAPIVEALRAYAARDPVSFHVPGHKRGTSFLSDPEIASWLGAAGPYDATELPGLDDLHAPSGVIREAERLAAELFGAERTYFLVGGSTVGNLAMLHAVCDPGDLVLMQRNVHKSALHALMLARGRAVMMAPEMDERTGLYGGVRPETVEKALRAHPEAKAVFITNPNYYGMGTDVERIAAVAHEHGKPLLVDEAHGAHFGLHPAFPPSAMSCGADAAVQSVHKTLSALTMGAVLHVRGDRLDRRRLERRLRMLQSSSPSYLILASIDWARKQAAQALAGEAFESGLTAAGIVRAAIRSGGLRLSVAEPGTARLNPLKLLLRDAAGEWTGFRIAELLREQGCDVEMATERYALCAFGIGSTPRHAERLIRAIEEITRRFPAEKQEISRKTANTNPLWINELTQPVRFDPDEGGKPDDGRAEIAAVALEEAAGAVCAETVVPYPPGIPVLFPGETVSEAAVRELIRLRAAGASFQGAEDASLRTLRVWRCRER